MVRLIKFSIAPILLYTGMSWAHMPDGRTEFQPTSSSPIEIHTITIKGKRQDIGPNYIRCRGKKQICAQGPEAPIGANRTGELILYNDHGEPSETIEVIQIQYEEGDDGEPFTDITFEPVE